MVAPGLVELGLVDEGAVEGPAVVGTGVPASTVAMFMKEPELAVWPVTSA